VFEIAAVKNTTPIMCDLSDKTGELIVGGSYEKELSKMQRNVVKELVLEQAGFRDYAERLGAPIVEAEDKIQICLLINYMKIKLIKEDNLDDWINL